MAPLYSRSRKGNRNYQEAAENCTYYHEPPYAE